MRTVDFTTAVKRSDVGPARHRMVDELLLVGLHLDDDERDMIMLLLSELLANAIEHAFGGEVEDPLVRLAIRAELHEDGRLRVSVLDPNPDVLPKWRPAERDSESGRGLLLISQFAADFGCDLEDSAKRVWFELALSITQDSPEDETEEPIVLTSTEQRQITAQRIVATDANRMVRDSRPAPWIGTIGTQRPVTPGGGLAA